MKFLKNKTVGKILNIILSFILCCCIIVCTMTALVRFTVFTPGFMVNVLNSSDYYADLCDEITDNLLGIGDASGLDKSFFEGFVDEVLVREDVQSYVEQFYAGEKLSVNTDRFEESLRSALDKYQSKKGISKENINKNSIDFFVKEANRIYAANVKISYLNSLQKTLAEKTVEFTMYAVISGVVALAICALLIFAGKWKHVAVRYIYYAVAASALFTAIIPAAVFSTGVIGKIAILSRSLNDLYTEMLSALFTDMLVAAGVLFVIAIVLIIVHGKLRKRVSST